MIGHMVIVGCPEYEFGHGSVRTTHCGDLVDVTLMDEDTTQSS